ncbi:hypothetical protein PTTG_09490 [Puccinia triticina 1-1 BBBD Race 1]|uniref:Uncharacterized protein n=2 Tax=Puccinia triticina TaxID=208348 RepID=A0A180G6C6_PUCT1|nr:uncharacterized protein PtA15_5A390 [Puccinia triticina]OAV87413.1 hypothetical protein PTTG_09490 [Puccinia triticina 1-1 BBBD Race 1]WAQ84817.1 hypothetical protein PtA15_5A390 [Puccinia triticina]WAR58160.1 hypothetical protein PtB15_5B392 [Puccinia triticina]
MTRISSTLAMTRQSRISPDIIKRTAIRRKREAEKALVRARDSLKVLLKAKYPARRPVEVGDTNSDTALASKDYVYEAPQNRRRGGGHGAPFLRSPLSYCPTTVVEPVVPQSAWVLFESPSFGARENLDMTSLLNCPIDALNLSSQPIMSDAQLSEGLAQWWAELETCWDLTLKAQEPLKSQEPAPEIDEAAPFGLTAEEYPLLFEMLKS